MVRFINPQLLAVAATALILAILGSRVVTGQQSALQDPSPGVAHILPPADLDELPSRTGRYQVINPQGPALNLVIGADGRDQVTNTTNFPNSAVTLIEAWKDGEDTVYLCTAAFVGPKVLLTAAHCLWLPEFGGFPDGVAVAPGINGNSTPFGIDFADEIWVPDGWIDERGDINEAFGFDYGLIVLDDDDLSDETGEFTVGAFDREELEVSDFNPSTAGYPADKPSGTQWFGSTEEFEQVFQQVLGHSIDVYFGQSGSPVWRGSDLVIAGVLSFETSDLNYALRITSAVLDDLNEACDQLGCDINQIETTGPDPTPTMTVQPTPTVAAPTETPAPTVSPTMEPAPSPTATASATPIPPPVEGDLGAFDRTWQRTDEPVQGGVADRTWMWGPAVTEATVESYDESGGFRTVRYHEKARMEITNPAGDAASIWYVTNGLLAWELITGQMQLGDARFEQRDPASLNVAGDPDDPGGPTYATFGALLEAPPLDTGATVIATLDREGVVEDDLSLAEFGVVAEQFVPETNHAVASVFWQFMNESGLIYEDGEIREDVLFQNPFFATGLPITEAYWTIVRVAGSEQLVLVQAFERRVLTYTPANSPGWRVETGNVGLHYYSWRYGES